MSSVVVDASAVLAILQDEPGTAVALHHADGALFGAVNLAETLAKVSDRGIAIEDALRLIDDLRPKIVPFNRRQAAVVASLRATTGIPTSLSGRSSVPCLGAQSARADGRSRLGNAEHRGRDHPVPLTLLSYTVALIYQTGMIPPAPPPIRPDVDRDPGGTGHTRGDLVSGSAPAAAVLLPRIVSPALAFAVAALGIGLFSIMDAVMKSLVLAVGVYNALFWRTAIATGLGAAAWRASGGTRPSGRGLRLHLMRGGVTAVMALLFFWGLGRVPMAQAITLTYIAPILALLLGALLLGERVGARVVLASVAAFAGVVVVLVGQWRGQMGPVVAAGAAAILASAVLYAVNLVLARLQSQAAGPGEIAFFQSGIVTLVLALAAPWLAVVPDAALWPRIVLGAGLATASLLLLGWAYAHADTGYLATTEYTSFVYAAMLGWLVFGERVSVFTLAGAGIIVAACLHAARRRDIAVSAEVSAA
jgi:S-adenosylmethionine uptake transporter